MLLQRRIYSKQYEMLMSMLSQYKCFARAFAAKHDIIPFAWLHSLMLINLLSSRMVKGTNQKFYLYFHFILEYKFNIHQYHYSLFCIWYIYIDSYVMIEMICKLFRYPFEISSFLTPNISQDRITFFVFEKDENISYFIH